MAQTFSVLGQQDPLATTLTDLYPVPGATETVVSSIFVCNRSATATTFRVSIAPGGAADENKHYLYYDIPIDGNETFASANGFTLATTDVIRVYAGAATLSFTAFGSEVTP